MFFFADLPLALARQLAGGWRWNRTGSSGRATIRLLWTLFVVVLALTVAAERFVDEPAHAGLAATFGFGAWFGFGACAALILVAKARRRLPEATRQLLRRRR